MPGERRHGDAADGDRDGRAAPVAQSTAAVGRRHASLACASPPTPDDQVVDAAAGTPGSRRCRGVGWTRLVSRMTWRSRSRSIQTEVPVKPRWPTVFGEKLVPALEPLGDGVSQPSAHVDPATRRSRVQNSRTMRRRHEVVAAPAPTRRAGGRGRVDVARRREQPGMAGDAAHGVGVVVVHLAAQHALAPRAAFGRRDHVGDRLDAPRAQHATGRRTTVARRPSGRKMRSWQKRSSVDAADLLDQRAEQHEAEIAVDGLACPAGASAARAGSPGRRTPWRRGCRGS